jgi:hypothetical protein
MHKLLTLFDFDKKPFRIDHSDFTHKGLKKLALQLKEQGRSFIDTNDSNLTIFFSDDRLLYAKYKGLDILSDSIQFLDKKWNYVSSWLNLLPESASSPPSEFIMNLKDVILSDDSLEENHPKSIKNAVKETFKHFLLNIFSRKLNNQIKKGNLSDPEFNQRMNRSFNEFHEVLQTHDCYENVTGIFEKIEFEINDMFALSVDDYADTLDFRKPQPLSKIDKDAKTLPIENYWSRKFTPSFVERIRLIPSKPYSLTSSFLNTGLLLYKLLNKAKIYFDIYFNGELLIDKKLDEIILNATRQNNPTEFASHLLAFFNKQTRANPEMFAKAKLRFKKAIKFFQKGVEFFNAAEYLNVNTKLFVAEAALDIIFSEPTQRSKRDWIALTQSSVLDVAMKNVIPAYYTLARTRFLYSSFGDNILTAPDKETFSAISTKLLEQKKDVLQLTLISTEEEKIIESFEQKLKEFDPVLKENKANPFYFEKSPLAFTIEHIEKYVKQPQIFKLNDFNQNN